MNLVAKEFCAARVDDEGVLILSEFAGAATELKGGALLVNPYDIEGVVSALYRAFHMSTHEQQTRMQRMRRFLQQYDVFHWCSSFCGQAGTLPGALKPLPTGVLPVPQPQAQVEAAP